LPLKCKAFVLNKIGKMIGNNDQTGRHKDALRSPLGHGTAPARGSARVLQETFLRGEIARGEVSRIITASPRTAQKATGELLAQRLLTSLSPKGPLCLGFPSDAAGHYFPNLYPAGAD
jgi:hypothetical protein